MGYELGMTIVELQSRLVWVKLMVVSCLAMTIGFYLFCSLVYPNHLVCLYHIDPSIPSDLAVTTTSLRTLGIALCRFSCMVMVRQLAVMSFTYTSWLL